MHLLEMRDVRMGFSDLDLFTIDQLDIASGERIGLIGANGSGKSTLLRLMLGELEPLAGSIKRYGDWSFFRQFDTAYTPEDLGKTDYAYWGLATLWQRDPETLSGGEKTRSRLAKSLALPGDMLLLDEPTSNLDLSGIEQLSAYLWAEESFILISHDRELLNEHCTRILEIREGRLFDYPGNYDAYVAWLASDLKRREAEYEQYQEEERRLQDLSQELAKRSHKVSKRPKGMSSSEAKARDFAKGRRSNDSRSKRLASAAKHTEKRIEQLEKKERPQQAPVIRPDFELTNPPRNRIIAEATALRFGYDPERLLLDDAAFQLKRGVRTALIGPNGCGKTAFCRLLVDGHEGIRSVPRAKYGYFRQELEWIDPERTVLENIRYVSCQSETVDRSVLARMGFYRDTVHRKAAKLSGGERVKLAFGMLFVSDINVLVLDEPTNYLDLPSREAIEALLTDYEGTLLFVSHDRTFIRRLADEIWTMEEGKIKVIKAADMG